MRSRNFNYIGDDLVKEWESSYLKNNPQIKRGGSRNLEEIWEKEVFPKSNEMINKLENDCKSHIQKFQIFWDKVKEKEDLLILNELIPNLIPKKLLGNEFDKMFHESLPVYVEIYETKKKEYFKEVDNWNTDKVEERKERLFSDEKIKIRIFYAPNHTYDKNTFIALKNCGINEIIDGYGLMPYTENDIKFIPQLFYKVLALPFGIQSTQIHLNYWKQKDFDIFEKFIIKNSNKIITYDQALKKINNNSFYKSIKNLSAIILKFKRIIKS